MSYERLQAYFFLAFLLGVLALTFFIFLPYLAPIVLAATLAILFKPVHRKVLSATGRREVIASLLTVLMVLVIILIPLVFFAIRFFDEAVVVYSGTVGGGEGSFLNRGVALLEHYLRPLNITVPFDIGAYEKIFLDWLLRNIGSIFSGAASMALGLFLTILALYYFLKDGSRLKEAMIAVSPLADVHDREVFKKLEKAVNSVVKGSLVVSVVQGVLLGIGFVLFGVPNAVFWGSVGVLAALVPTVGTALITVPATIYLFVSGELIFAVGFLIWGLLLVGTVDNFLRPKLIERGINIHPFFILLSVLGGIGLFGAIGFLLGPLVLSLLFALLDIYQKEFKAYVNRT